MWVNGGQFKLLTRKSGKLFFWENGKFFFPQIESLTRAIDVSSLRTYHSGMLVCKIINVTFLLQCPTTIGRIRIADRGDHWS